jgi:dipeptidyl aminopeptidase/acylaminoacyl peptidase
VFVRFPDENHELTRSGKPRHRLERFRILLEWFARYLRPA